MDIIIIGSIISKKVKIYMIRHDPKDGDSKL